MELILASASPRRREILREIFPNFRIEPSRFEEKGDFPPKETALFFAIKKAEEVFSRFQNCAVIGADTVVSLDGKIKKKPTSKEDAIEILRSLSGKKHLVYTGVCLLKGDLRLFGVETTAVNFYSLSEELISRYVASGLPFGKAGAYGIQDGYPLVESIEGSYTNVVGFPRELVEEYLRKADLC